MKEDKRYTEKNKKQKIRRKPKDQKNEKRIELGKEREENWAGEKKEKNITI